MISQESTTKDVKLVSYIFSYRFNYIFSYFRKVSIEKQNYFKNLFTKHKNDIKKTWHSIKLLLGKDKKQLGCKIISAEGKDLTEPVEIANHFNNYFSTVAENLVKKIPSTNINPSSFLGPNLSNSFYLYPTTPQEIKKNYF